MKETIPALALCSSIYLLDFCFYVYLANHYANCDLEPEEFGVTSVMIGLFAFVHFMGFQCGLGNIIGIKNSYCRKFREKAMKSNTFVCELWSMTLSNQYLTYNLSIPIRSFCCKYIYFWLQLFAWSIFYFTASGFFNVVIRQGSSSKRCCCHGSLEGKTGLESKESCCGQEFSQILHQSHLSRHHGRNWRSSTATISSNVQTI